MHLRSALTLFALIRCPAVSLAPGGAVCESR